MLIPGSSPVLRVASAARGLTRIGRHLGEEDPLRAALGIARALKPQVADLTQFLPPALPKPKRKEPEHDPPIEMEIPFGRPPDDPDRDW